MIPMLSTFSYCFCPLPIRVILSFKNFALKVHMALALIEKIIETLIVEIFFFIIDLLEHKGPYL